MVYYTIPATETMEPFEGCFRKLLPSLVHSIDPSARRRHTVVTDVPWITEFVKSTRMKVVDGTEVSDFKSAIEAHIANFNENKDDDFVLLPIEYPQRTNRHVMAVLSGYRRSSAKSMLCRTQSPASASKLLTESPNSPWFENLGGESWQDQTPQAFEHSHMVSVVERSELPELNHWLWNPNTDFFDVGIDANPTTSQDPISKLPYGTDSEHEFDI